MARTSLFRQPASQPARQPASQPARIRQSNNQELGHSLAGGTWTSAFGETLTEYGGGTSKHDRNRQGDLDCSQCLDLILAAGGTWKAAGETGKAGAGFHEDKTINVIPRLKQAPPPGGHVFQPTRPHFDLFHEDRKINVAYRVFTRQILTPHD
ncbi:hypothetical protein DPMN_148441 [Dreissena polymorpha]|uniref:Uncharacterized protein n=1 Tax=Dreissena polymorpha TaxID=45954 RepID=A0A9D4J076_DREPO|nr:hypothetical protein DPMN_148441 [Dreissena polymorpha]